MAIDKRKDTSWEPIESWYRGSVGEEGHYYHQHLILPGALRMLALKEGDSVLDLACGPGVLGRRLSPSTQYQGVDLSRSFIKTAQAADKAEQHRYLMADITHPLSIVKRDFSHCTLILALQNVEDPKSIFKNAAAHLKPSGRFLIVMNHPCFRIPRQSSWKVDPEQKVQYRRIDRYSSPLSIPIQAHPGKGGQSETTWSFHSPLAVYSQALYEAGFVIELMEEWHSDKKSSGSAARMENRSRDEIPLFLAIRALKWTMDGNGQGTMDVNGRSWTNGQ